MTMRRLAMLVIAGAVTISARAAAATAPAEPALAAAAEDFLRQQRLARGETPPSEAQLAATIRSALAARRRFPWGERVPPELFLRYVLPETNLTEPPSPWRDELAGRLAPLLDGAASAGEAAVRLNDGMWKLLGVGYDAKPPHKPDLPPAQTIHRGSASCTSLAILLVDACRAFGIPARVAGIPAWVVPKDDPRARGGYHQWVEIWDGSWRSLSAIDSSPLDRGWFVERAARTDVSRPEHRIFAASFAATGRFFPLPWARELRSVPGIDVTSLYTRRRAMRFELPSGARLELRRDGELFAVATSSAQELFLGAGESYDWTLTAAEGEPLASGRLELGPSTPSPFRLPVSPAQAGAADGSSASHSRTSSPLSPQVAHFAIEPR